MILRQTGQQFRQVVSGARVTIEEVGSAIGKHVPDTATARQMMPKAEIASRFLGILTAIGIELVNPPSLGEWENEFMQEFWRKQQELAAQSFQETLGSEPDLQRRITEIEKRIEEADKYGSHLQELEQLRQELERLLQELEKLIRAKRFFNSPRNEPGKDNDGIRKLEQQKSSLQEKLRSVETQHTNQKLQQEAMEEIWNEWSPEKQKANLENMVPHLENLSKQLDQLLNYLSSPNITENQKIKIETQLLRWYDHLLNLRILVKQDLSEIKKNLTPDERKKILDALNILRESVKKVMYSQRVNSSIRKMYSETLMSLTRIYNPLSY